MRVRTFAYWTRIALSSDGKWLAYAVQNKSQHETLNDAQTRYFTRTGVSYLAVNCDIWLTDTRTGQSKNLTEGQGTSWGPVWSPNGEYLAFYSDRGGVARVWVWEQQSGQFRQLSEAIERSSTPLEVLRWTPDSRQLVTKVLPHGMTLERAAALINAPAPRSMSANSGGTSTATVYSSVPTGVGERSAASPSTDLEVIKDDLALAFYAADFGLIDVATSKITYLIQAVHPVNYWISPDGRYLAYMDFKGKIANTGQQVFDLGLYSFVDQSNRILVPGIVDVADSVGMSVSFSPDSRLLAYNADAHLNDSTDSGLARGDCFVVSIDGSKPRNLTKGNHPPFQSGMFAPLWDSKGHTVYLTVSTSSSVSGLLDSRISTIWKALVPEDAVSELATIPGRSVLGVLAASGGNVAWSPDNGNSLVVGTQDETTRQAGFWKVELFSGKTTKLFEDNIAFSFPMEFALSTDVSRDNETAAYFSENAQHPQEIYLARSDFSDRRRVTNINPQLANVWFGSSRSIEYKSLDGIPLHGALLLPANYVEGRRYPLILWLYSGSFMSREVYRFGLESSIMASLNLQVLASHGYAVLVADAPLNMGTPVLDLLKAVMPAVDRIVDMGIADPGRLGVMGHSYGGYSTLALIEQTRRFKAAVDYAGLSNLISFYGYMDHNGTSNTAWTENGQGRMGGNPWEFRDRYIENSPVFFLDRIQTPLLLVHGELDTQPQQAEEVFVGLRRLGKQVVYVKYRGEGHVLESPANVVDYWHRVINWFDKHLKRDGPQQDSSLPQTNPRSAGISSVSAPLAWPAASPKLPALTMQDALSLRAPTVSYVNWLAGNSVLIGSWKESEEKSPTMVAWDLETLNRSSLGVGKYLSTSPDGRWIVYLDAKQWRLKSLSQGKIVSIGNESSYEPTVYTPPKWSRDGRYVALMQTHLPSQGPPLVEEPETGGEVRVVDVGRVADTAISEGRIESQTFVSIVEVRTPDQCRTIKVEEPDAYYGDWGPGTNFYFVAMQGYWTGSQAYTAVKRLDVRSMTVSEVFRSPGYMQGAAPMVSPDGSKIAIALDIDNKRWSDYNSLVLVEASSGKLTRLTTNQYVTGSYTWAQDGKALYFTARHGGLAQIYRVDLQGRATRISQDERRYFDLQRSPDGYWLSYQTADGYGRNDIRIRSTETGEERVVAVLANPAKDFRLGEFQHVHWKSPDGLELWGFLFLPPAFDRSKKYPLYVDVHGGGRGFGLSLLGPLGAVLTASPLEWHAWASVGYIVFVPDMRSSGEYGPQVAAALYASKDWDEGGIQSDARDVEIGTRWVLNHGYVDPKRIAVSGHSAGGARVNFLLTRSTLYGAGIVHDPIESGALPRTIDATSGEQTGVGFDEAVLSKGVTFAEDPSVYTGGFLFDGYRSRTPTLILVGNPEKGAVNSLSAEVLFSMLRQYKIPTRMLRYLDDGHNPSTVASALHRYNEIRKWLEKYIRAPSEGQQSSTR